MKDKETIEIPKDFFDDVNFNINLPTFICACGKRVLMTQENLQKSLNYVKEIINQNNNNE